MHISLHLVLNRILPFPAGNNGRCLVGGVSHRSVVLAESILLTLVTDVRSVVPWPVKTHSYPEFKGFPCVDNVGRFWTVSTSCNRRNDKRLQKLFESDFLHTTNNIETSEMQRAARIVSKRSFCTTVAVRECRWAWTLDRRTIRVHCCPLPYDNQPVERTATESDMQSSSRPHLQWKTTLLTATINYLQTYLLFTVQNGKL